LKAQDADEFVSLMLMAHADDLRFLGVDTGRFAAQLRAALRNPLLPADGERLVAIEKQVLGEEYSQPMVLVHREY
jgi:hypothetical protein